MPELPEVETTRRGIAPALIGHRIQRAVVRQPSLRWPVPADLDRHVAGQRVRDVGRRAKYLLIRLDQGSVLMHLGMSGRLRVLPPDSAVERHDHLDLVMETGQLLRLHDPRRFGAVLWAPQHEHPLLTGLGPEPLSDAFDGAHLHARCRGRRAAIKVLLMDARIVVGVGNIYASEALFRAGIDPRRAGGRISAARFDALAQAVRAVLSEAVERGGTTLRDYTAPDGAPGWFRLQLAVYERQGKPCTHCGTAIRRVLSAQRSTYFCPHCQR